MLSDPGFKCGLVKRIRAHFRSGEWHLQRHGDEVRASELKVGMTCRFACI